MMYKKGRVAVTGIGLMTSVGGNREENWISLVNGRSGVKLIDRFETENLITKIAAVVDRFDTDGGLSGHERTRLMLESVIEEAAFQAWKGEEPVAQIRRAAIYLAIPGGEGFWDDRIAYHQRCAAGQGAERSRRAQTSLMRDGQVSSRYLGLQARFDLDTPPAIVTTACASGATAIQMGVEAIRRGDTTLAIAAGADSTVFPEGMIRFSLLSALSRRNEKPVAASRPFDRDRDGFVMGEGAAALILEAEEAAVSRGAEILGFVSGCGDTTDNFHRTRSNPSGERILACIRRALDDADVRPNDIHSVNAHGTSTPENDKMEALGLRLALGQAVARVPVTSNKSMIGHTLSAAGIVEAAIALLSLSHGIVTPSINVDTPDEALGLNVAMEAVFVPDMRYILSNSFGFGGQNVSLVLERAV